jgi:hypothetical protein
MPSSPRRFTLMDAMALVAATSLGFAILRWTWPGFWPTYGYSWPLDVPSGTVRAYVEAAARQALGAGPPVVLCLTLAFFLVRLRGDGPPLRRLARQSGTAACLATLPAFLIVSAAYAVLNVIPGRVLESWYALLLLSYLAGPAVAGVWGTMAASGRWRGPRDWVEGWGVALGACWIGLTLLALYSLRR